MPLPPRFDALGIVVCGAGVASLQFALENAGHWLLPPALDLELFAIRTFRISSLVGGLSRVSVNAVPFMLPLLFRVGFGLSPVQSGSLTFLTSLGALVGRPVSAVLLRASASARCSRPMPWSAPP